MMPEEKINLLQEYPGFVFFQKLKLTSVMYHCYLTFPNGDESTHYYDTDRDALINNIFEHYYTLMSNTCDIIERT